MPKMRHNLSDVQTLEPVPNNWYVAHPYEAVYETSKASISRGQPEKMFTIHWEIEEGEFKGRKIMFDTVSMSPKAAGFVAEFLDACRVQRTCLSCGKEFTEGRKVTRDESKIHKSGIACPHCLDQGDTEWDSGPMDENTGKLYQDPDGKTGILNYRCLIGVVVEPSKKDGVVQKNPDGTPKMNNKVEHYAPIQES